MRLNMFKHRSIVCVIFAVMFVSVTWADWPQFRGPNNDGWPMVQPDGNAKPFPLEFGENKNVKWKTAIHDRGWSTPVIWENQIWLTSATEDGHKMYVFCVDRDTGEILLDRQQFFIESPSPLGNDVNTYASPSPVIEAGRVYVHFGSYGTACIDTTTFDTLWQRQDLPCNHFRGPASSPVIFEDKLILTFDGSDLQYQAALDKKTGDTVWKTDRKTNFKDLDSEGKPQRDGDMRKAYGTPLIVTVDGQSRMYISSSYDAFCYDPGTGEEIWRIDHDGYSPASMALFGHGLLYIITGRSQPEMLAVRPGGHGDIAKTHIVWRYDKGLPSMVSPILVDDLIFFANNGGVITCIEAKTGQLVWKDRLKGQYYSSPVCAGGNLYFCNVSGDVTVLKPGRTMEIIQLNKLDDGFMSSPAISGSALYLRSKSNLYRIERM